MTLSSAPFNCGCGCCGRWSARYHDLAPRLAQGTLRLLLEELLTDPGVVAAGRAVPASELPREADDNP